MCVFRPVLQRFGSDIAHVLHVKAGGCGSSANQCTAHVWKWRHVLVNMKSPIRLPFFQLFIANLNMIWYWNKHYKLSEKHIFQFKVIFFLHFTHNFFAPGLRPVPGWGAYSAPQTPSWSARHLRWLRHSHIQNLTLISDHNLAALGLQVNIAKTRGGCCLHMACIQFILLWQL